MCGRQIVIGEIAGLTTAALWAGTSLAFALAGKRIGALAVNQIRIIMAILMLPVLHQVLLGAPWPSSITSPQLIYLAISGVVGLSLGDLFYFHSLAVIGPRLGALLMSTWPVLCALIAWPVLGEELGLGSVLGIGVTLSGVLLVLGDRRGKPRWIGRLTSRSRRWAIAAGLLGATGQAAGLVIAKLGMGPLGEGGRPVDPLSATLVRMVAGALGIWIVAAVGGHVPATLGALRDRGAMLATFVGAVLGPTFGVWMSLVAAAHTDAGVAATLMATMPILALPLARVAYGSRPGPVAIGGTVLAVVGVAVLFLAQSGG
jgi:drug/metabolite transporter (DMT)-like permease